MARKLQLLAVSLLVSVALLEQGYRTYLFGAAAFSYPRMTTMVPIAHAGFVEAAREPEIPYVLRPGFEGWFKGAPIRTNSAGWPEREYALRPEPGTRRIAVLGDSYSMASGVPLSETWHEQLEASWNGPGRDPLEILSFSVGGCGLAHYRVLLEERLPRWGVDEVWVAFCADNDHRPVGPPRRPFVPQRIDGFFVSRVGEVLGLLRVDQPAPRTTLSDDERAYVDASFAHFAGWAAAHERPLTILYLDNRPAEPAIRDGIRQLSDRHGLPFIDVTGAFRGTDRADWSIYYPIDPHPNARAHERMADEIERALGAR